jgi:radical SAM superfamily enzyme YgiQ (UPF0313 family)
MKILLLEHPRTISRERCNDIANTPLSSCLLTGYAAAILKSKGHEVEIVEGHLDELSYAEIRSRVRDMNPHILGVNMVYHWQKDLALYGFLEQVKNEGLSPFITAYGFYPTVAFEDILQECSAIDSIIIGEPELTFAELTEALDIRVYPANISGLALRDRSGKIAYQQRQLVEDLDSLPFPERTEAMYRLPEVNLQGSRGCYGGCTFCYINPFYGPGSKWRSRSPENIIAEIDSIIAERGVREFYFTDPNFFGPGQRGQDRALRLASLLRTRNICFGIEARVNDIHEKTVGALVDAGLRHILIGLESGKDQSLKRMNKMTTVAQNEKAIRILREHGIEPNVGFIMFEPDATLEDIRVNFEFLKRNDLLKNLAVTANVLYHHQIILKGTPAYQNLQRVGRLEIQSSSTYEGTTSFADPQVAVLADIMRRITNFLFARMAGIWSGKMEEPQDAGERYTQINGRLVEWFETILKALEAGDQFTEKLLESFVEDANKEIYYLTT